MLNTEFLQFKNWILSDIDFKHEILKSFEGYNGYDIKLKSLETNLVNNYSYTTGIFEFQGKEFVFVPGCKLELGWNGVSKQDEYIIPAISEELDIAYNSKKLSVNDFLKEVFSPIRECKIDPMIVERNVIRIINNDGLVNYDELIGSVKQEGISVLTEDEWEYLCGFGTRSIFSESINKEVIEDICIRKKYFYNYNLENINHFGLFISYDPYMYEIVDSPCYVKGGDGGCATHGGYCVLGILPISPHYRDYDMIDSMKYTKFFECDVFIRHVFRILGKDLKK